MFSLLPGMNDDIDDDPVYQTIQSANRTLEVPIEIHPSRNHPDDISEPPDLPPRLGLEEMNESERLVLSWGWWKPKILRLEQDSNQQFLPL